MLEIYLLLILFSSLSFKLEYPSNCQMFGNPYYEKSKQSKENNRESYNIIKLNPQSSANKYGYIQVCIQSQPIRNNLKILRSSANINTTHTHSHTLHDDGRSISRNIPEKLKDNMNTTESTNTNIFKIICYRGLYAKFVPMVIQNNQHHHPVPSCEF